MPIINNKPFTVHLVELLGVDDEDSTQHEMSKIKASQGVFGRH